MRINYYAFEELAQKAIESPSRKNCHNLLEWFSNYGADYWNGECYVVDTHFSLYPVYGKGGHVNYWELR